MEVMMICLDHTNHYAIVIHPMKEPTESVVH
jgi:hypothetical protein